MGEEQELFQDVFWNWFWRGAVLLGPFCSFIKAHVSLFNPREIIALSKIGKT